MRLSNINPVKGGWLTFLFRDPSRLDPTPPAKWEPKVLGMNKRDLLQEVLPILGQSSPEWD